MSNAPSADLGQHVEAIDPPRIDDRAFRQGWRVRTRLDALLAADRITSGQWQAAVEYRDAFSRVLADGGGSPGGYRVSGGSGHDRLLGLLDTISRLRAVDGRIGAHLARLCHLCVVEDRSWAAIAAILDRCNPETARDRTVVALRSLAVAWAGTRRGASDASTGPENPSSPCAGFLAPAKGMGRIGNTPSRRKNVAAIRDWW